MRPGTDPPPRLTPDDEMRVRFVHLYGRSPSPRELTRFHRAHGSLVLGFLARARRRIASIPTGWG